MKIMPDESALLDEGAMRINDAVAWSGIGRSSLYKLISKGDVRSIWAGGRRLIPKAGLRAYLENGLDPPSR